MPRKIQYTVQEAFDKFSELGITDSIQVVRKWIREKKLKGLEFTGERRKEGYRIERKDLDEFIRNWIKENGKTKAMEYLEELKELRKEVQEYRKKYGPLKTEDKKENKVTHRPSKTDTRRSHRADAAEEGLHTER